MKRLLFLIIIGFHSYTSTAETFGFGVRGGVVSTKLRAESDFGLSGTGGIFFRISWGDFYLEPAMDYSHLTAKIKENGRNQTQHYASLSVPVLTGFYLLNKTKLKVRIFGGLSLTFPYRAIADDFNNYYNSYEEEEEHNGWIDGSYLVATAGSKARLNANVGTGIDLGRRFVLDIIYQEGRFRHEERFKPATTISATVGIKLHANKVKEMHL